VAGTTLHGRLPHVDAELTAVARHMRGQVLRDGEATRSAIVAAAGRAAVVHLATHGGLHATDPLFSYLQLADGRLSTADIYDLDLSCALVTLSACETGRGHLGGGDDLAGLGGAFLHAGADALVLSLWPVEDERTALLMDAFYGALVSGEAKDRALRRAQLALLDGAGGPAGHPYFWAPFILIGDHRPLVLSSCEL
jgi:CHAT domain-containing protein